MSIKRILAFVLLLILAYVGVYMVIYGVDRYTLYSGAERNFNMMSSSELQPKLNLKGDIQTVTKMLYRDTVTSEILGIPVGKATLFYYIMPIGYQENVDKQEYCLIAVSNPDDVTVVEKLMKDDAVPLDPDAPRFEFRGMALDIPTELYQRFKKYLQDKYYDEESIHDILYGANVDGNLVPYVIYVKSKNDENMILPIAVGGASAVLGVGLFILLAISTYKKAHMY